MHQHLARRLAEPRDIQLQTCLQGLLSSNASLNFPSLMSVQASLSHRELVTKLPQPRACNHPEWRCSLLPCHSSLPPENK